MAIRTTVEPPAIAAVDLGRTRGEAAAAGAVEGAVQLSTEWIVREGPMGLLVLPVLAAAGLVAGGIEGAMSGEPAEQLALAERNAETLLDGTLIQSRIAVIAVEYAAESRVPGLLKPNGTTRSEPTGMADSADTVLEIGVTTITVAGGLRMTALARLISVADGEVLDQAIYVFSSEPRSRHDWVTSGAASLGEVLERGLRTLAEQAVDEAFLLFHPLPSGAPIQADPSSKLGLSGEALIDAAVPPYVLKPRYPKLEICILFCDQALMAAPRRSMGVLRFVPVEGTTPTLRWESFPGSRDLRGPDGRPRSIKNIRYDVKVLDVEAPGDVWGGGGGPGAFVPGRQRYAANGLRSPQHRIANALEPCTEYFWTVRARFELDGRDRVTEWAGAFKVRDLEEETPWELRRGRSTSSWTVPRPEWFYFPFRTACG